MRAKWNQISDLKLAYEKLYKEKCDEIYACVTKLPNNASLEDIRNNRNQRDYAQHILNDWFSKNPNPYKSFDEWMSNKIGFGFTLHNTVIVL